MRPAATCAIRVIRIPFEVDDVVAMVRKVFAGRVVFHDGTEQIAPGITVHKIGGHSKGLQSVRVKTRRGYVVLASDATHLYAHINEGRVFPVTYQRRRRARGLQRPSRSSPTPSITSFPDTIRRCSKGIRRRRPGSRSLLSAWMSIRRSSTAALIVWRRSSPAGGRLSRSGSISRNLQPGDATDVNPAASQKPTFNKDIAPILYEHCSTLSPARRSGG